MNATTISAFIDALSSNASFSNFSEDHSQDLETIDYIDETGDLNTLLEEYEGDRLFEFLVVGLGISAMAVMGILGNTLTMMVLSRPQMRSSVCYLLFGLAVCDLMLLLIIFPVYGITVCLQFFGVGPSYTEWFIPHAVPYLLPILATAQTGSVYFTMSVSVERYIAVCWPLKSRFLCTWSRARYYAAIVVLFSILVNIPRWFELQTNTKAFSENIDGLMSLVPVHEVGYTNLRSDATYTNYYMYPSLFVIQHIFPFIVLSVFNFAIYCTIKRANTTRQGLTSVQTREISFALMLVFVVIIFLCCNSLNLFLLIWEIRQDDFSVRYLFLANFLKTFNSSINFLVYCAFGSNFRQQFVSFCMAHKLFTIDCTRRSKHTQDLYFSSL